MKIETNSLQKRVFPDMSNYTMETLYQSIGMAYTAIGTPGE
jgi:hypothetical protein